MVNELMEKDPYGLFYQPPPFAVKGVITVPRPIFIDVDPNMDQAFYWLINNHKGNKEGSD